MIYTTFVFIHYITIAYYSQYHSMKFHLYAYIDMIAPILLWYIAIVYIYICLSLLTLLIIGDIHCYIPNTYYMVIIILICKVFMIGIT